MTKYCPTCIATVVLLLFMIVVELITGHYDLAFAVFSVAFSSFAVGNHHGRSKGKESK
jgi:hypothetical protein